MRQLYIITKPGPFGEMVYIQKILHSHSNKQTKLSSERLLVKPHQIYLSTEYPKQFAPTVKRDQLNQNEDHDQKHHDRNTNSRHSRKTQKEWEPIRHDYDSSEDEIEILESKYNEDSADDGNSHDEDDGANDPDGDNENREDENGNDKDISFARKTNF